MADDAGQPQPDVSPVVGLGDLDNIVINLDEAIQRLRALKRKPG